MKKWKTFLSLLLALTMAFTLAACSGSSSSEDTGSEDTASSDAEETTEDTADDTATVSGESVTLVMSTSKNETETAGMVMAYFCDYVEENSGGTITFNRNYGGTLASSSEELEMVQSGSIDVVALSHSTFADYLPLLQFPNFAQEDNAAGLEYMEYMLNDSGEAAELLAAEALDNGVIMLDFIAGGSTVLTSTFEFDELSETFSKKFGTGVNASAYESIGFSVVSMEVSDGYESLSRGVVDLAVMSFAPTVQMGWYEAAPYYYYVGTHSAGNPITINADTYNSLSEDQQAVLVEAAAAAAEYSLELVNADEEEYVSTVEEAGGFVKEMSDEDTEYYFSNYYVAIAADAYARAEELGITDDMTTVLQASADYLGVDISSVVGE